MEEFSRRLWAPAQQGSQRETKWFYERARGQYADAQSKLTPSEQKRFQAEYPKLQVFTKTDLAKFENVWDGYPISVNHGAQKNFADYATRIGQEWEKQPDKFNELYFKQAISRAIIFRRTEKIVSSQDWYNGGYRANIVAYTIAILEKVCSHHGKFFDFITTWKNQDITKSSVLAIEIASKLVYEVIISPRRGLSNISEWCKRESCWVSIQDKTDILISLLPEIFFSELISYSEIEYENKSALKIQKLTNKIEAQKTVIEIASDTWSYILLKGRDIGIFSPKEISILQIAAQIPYKIPTEKQSLVLLDILEKAKAEAIYK